MKNGRKPTINLEPEREKAVLVEVLARGRGFHESDSLDELFRLADTAELDVLDTMVQYRARLEPATCIGRGKVEELAARAADLGADTVVFGNELSPAQVRNLEKALKVKVVDRSELIMDIFARHARSRQAKIQIELAQLEYSLPRLRRMWTHLSRIKGGIGLRGPGEKQIEVDRRAARKRIAELKRKLREIEDDRRHRVNTRAGEHTVSLVGYTNAGKSTLMNALTDASTKVEDRLFATLDTLTRVCDLGGGRKALLSDTVGFIRSLPHHLVASFYATLEEVSRADLLLHVVDASHPEARSQIDVVSGVLKEIGCADRPVIVVLNKIDAAREPIETQALLHEFPGALAVSALKGDGMERLRKEITTLLDRRAVSVTLRCRWKDGKTHALLRTKGRIVEERSDGEGCVMRMFIDGKHLDKLLLDGSVEIVEDRRSDI